MVIMLLALLGTQISCEEPCPVDSVEGVVSQTPPALKEKLAGLLIRNEYWLLSNDFGDTLELSAKSDYQAGRLYFQPAVCDDSLVEGFEGRRRYEFKLSRRDTIVSRPPQVSTREVLIRHAGGDYPLTVRLLNLLPRLEWPPKADHLTGDAAWRRKFFLPKISRITRIFIPS